MRKLCLRLLAGMIIVSLILSGATAEMDEELELDIVSDEMEVTIEPEDEVILEDDDGLPDEFILPVIDGLEGITLYSPEGSAEPDTVLADNAVTNDSSPWWDFEIVDDVLIEYKGAGGDVIIPDGVTAIGNNAFDDCDLISVVIPDSVTSIGRYAFYSCWFLSSVSIPNSVTSIGDAAFAECKSLTSITIPDSVANIGAGIFRGSTCLEEINVTSGNTHYTSRDGILYTHDMKTLVQCPGARTSVTIPNSVTTIGAEAFSFGELTSISIPNSVTNIGNNAFATCFDLTDVSIPNSVTTIDKWAFSNCQSLTSITIPKSVTTFGSDVFYACIRLTNVSIENGLTTIGSGMFSGCYNLTSINIPDTVTTIGSGAFFDCNMSSIGIPNSVTTIGSGAFRYCESLTSVIIPNGVEYLEGHTFENCSSLTDVTILNGELTIWYDNDFEGCSANLTFHTPCESKVTKWVESHGYNVVKSDHTPVTDPAVAPTCTETGLTEGSHCSGCGEVFVAQQVIPKLSSIKDCKITIKDQVYTGKAIKPNPTVKYNGTKLVKGTGYTVAYANNKAIGTATVTITGIGEYGDSVKKTFKINPRAVTLSSVTPGSNNLTVKWKKGKNITGYEVQYSLKSNFSSAKKVTISKAGTVNTVLKGLTPNKKYYIRIRTYKTVGKKKYYSAWSKTKSAKPKK